MPGRPVSNQWPHAERVSRAFDQDPPKSLSQLGSRFAGRPGHAAAAATSEENAHDDAVHAIRAYGGPP